MTTITADTLKRQILASKISNLRSLNNEAALKWELARFFQDLRDKVLKELEEYYPEDETGILLEGHIDLILSPIFESQRQYYRILRRFNSKEYTFGAREAKRLVKLAKKFNKGASKSQTIKIDSLIDHNINKDKLFGTQDWSRDKLLQQSFTASEHTMNRVDASINKILSEGYTSGKGIKVVREDIFHRFGQLADWEANRIARTEIHNAHQMGMMNTYQDLGVEYTQWLAAHDSRTRDTHLELDGEIIPLGGTYSNGLQFPGDTKGSLKEWINCRCSNVPFIIPDGYMAPPGMAQFRESDLVPTLDYWNADELIAQPTQEIEERQAKLYGIPIKESLIENKFAVPTGDYSEFGINKKGLKTIQQIQKRNFGESREYGFCFDNKTGKIITDEIQGNSANVEIPKLNREGYSSVHNHTDNGLSTPSPEDFYDHWLSKNETTVFHLSRNETWAISVDNISQKKITKICDNIYKIEVNQIEKMVTEHDNLKLMVEKGKMTQKELNEYLANKFIYKHNKECGDKILKYTSNIKGVKVKREFNNTNINPDKIKELKGIKTIKYNSKSKSIRKSPQIKGYNKYALTEAENAEYERLKALKEKEGLTFHDKRKFNPLADRKEFNELRNKILLEGGDPNDIFALYGAEGVRYERLFKQFKDWEPVTAIEIKPIKINKKQFNNNKEAFQLTDEEKKARKQLKDIGVLTDDEKKYKWALDDKIKLNRYQEQLVEGKLDPVFNDEYIRLYNQHKKEWDFQNYP